MDYERLTVSVSKQSLEIEAPEVTHAGEKQSLLRCLEILRYLDQHQLLDNLDQYHILDYPDQYHLLDYQSHHSLGLDQIGQGS